MLLKSFSYESKSEAWKLEQLDLAQHNLLVGASGVGKTRALNAIRRMRWAALGSISTTHSVYFKARFEHHGIEYVWELDGAVLELEVIFKDIANAPIVRHEVLSSSRDGEILRRDLTSFSFKGKPFPTLTPSRSALSLIAEEPVSSVVRAWADCVRFVYEPKPFIEVPRAVAESPPLTYYDDTDTPAHGHWLLRALKLQEQQPEAFLRLKALYSEIFPTVESLKFTRQERQQAGGEAVEVGIEIREHGVPRPLVGGELSSGMLRALSVLTEVLTSEEGSVLLLDEFENSFGVNCLAPMAQFILSRSQDVQYILTSHHPYIVDQFPVSSWRLLVRTGNVVRGIPGDQIRALQGASAHDAFIRLINSSEYEGGIS